MSVTSPFTVSRERVIEAGSKPLPAIIRPVSLALFAVGLAIFLYGVIRTGRWWRRVKPPEPKPRRVKE